VEESKVEEHLRLGYSVVPLLSVSRGRVPISRSRQVHYTSGLRRRSEKSSIEGNLGFYFLQSVWMLKETSKPTLEEHGRAGHGTEEENGEGEAGVYGKQKEKYS